MIHRPHGRQLELLKGAEKHQMGLNVIGATHSVLVLGSLPFRGRNRHSKNSWGRACHASSTDMLEGSSRLKVRRKNKATILA